MNEDEDFPEDEAEEDAAVQQPRQLPRLFPPVNPPPIPHIPDVPLQDDGLPAVEPEEIPLAYELPEHQHVPEQEDSYITNVAAWLAKQHEIFADLVLQPEQQQQQPSTSRKKFDHDTREHRPRTLQPTTHEGMRPMLQQWTTNGVKLPFEKNPPSKIQQESYVPQNTVAFNSVEKEIKKLQDNGFITRIKRQHVKISMPIFAVPKSSQDKTNIRLVYDARYVNKFLDPPPFKLPQVPTSFRSCPKGFAFVSDISSGYHHIPLHPSAKPYLCFRWRGFYFQWEVLPFGLSTAPWIFQTWLSSYLHHWKKTKGDHCFLRQYIDDIFCAHKNKEKTEQLRQSLLQYFQWHGIKAHPDKTSEVSTKVKYLGYVLDIQAGHVSLTKGRVAQIRRLIGFLNSAPRVPRKFLEKMLGLINWCRAGSRQVLALIKPLYLQLHRTKKYFVSFKKHSLDFVVPLLTRSRSFRFHTAPENIFTDATLHQGAYIVRQKPTNFKIPQKYQTSSFASEFFAAKQAILANTHCHHIRIFCDNIGVCYVLRKGTTNHALVASILPRFWAHLEERNVKLSIIWIRTDVNPADYYSRSALLSHRYG